MLLKKKNILFLTSWFPNKKHPALGIFIQRHAEAAALYNNVTILFVCSYEDSLLPVQNIQIKNIFQKDVTTENNVFIVRVYYKKAFGFLKLIRYLKAHLIGYNEILKNNSRPDLVHLNVISPAGIFGLWLNTFQKIPLVISEHWSRYMPEDGNYKGFWMKWLTKKTVKKTKAIITVSEKLKQAMVTHGLKGNYSVIPNAVNTKIFCPPQSPSKRGNVFRLFHISSLNDKEKNITGMLRSIKKLSEIRQDFSLEIAGESGDKKYFETMAVDLGLLNKYVFFKGSMDPLAVAEYMKNADAFILFSNYETFSVVITEVLACGLPVVSTRTGVAQTAINETNGKTVDIGDEEAFVKAIMQVMENINNYKPSQISKYAFDNFSYEKVGKQLTDIYNQTS